MRILKKSKTVKQMKKVMFILGLWGFLFSCTPNAPMTITPIKDKYAKKNGGTPVLGYYHIQHFEDTRDSIKKAITILEKDVLPQADYQIVMTILESESDVAFEDGVAWVNENIEFKLLVSIDSLRNYKSLITSGKDFISPFRFEKENTVAYTMVQEENNLSIQFSYDEFNLQVLQKFLNIANYEYHKTKKQEGEYTYQLMNTTSKGMDCKIVYHNNPKKGELSIFRIYFP